MHHFDSVENLINNRLVAETLLVAAQVVCCAKTRAKAVDFGVTVAEELQRAAKLQSTDNK